MICKHSALVAVVIAAALAGFGGRAFAADKDAWAPPNVPGMPGYKEPPKGPDQPKAPIPVPSVDASSASYLQRTEPEKK
jgi:hypothetical protein